MEATSTDWLANLAYREGLRARAEARRERDERRARLEESRRARALNLGR